LCIEDHGLGVPRAARRAVAGVQPHGAARRQGEGEPVEAARLEAPQEAAAPGDVDGLDQAQAITPVGRVHIAVVTLLGGAQEAVAAGLGAAGGAAAVAARQVAVVAALAVFAAAVATHRRLDRAVRRAPVARVGVAVVTGLARVQGPVAAAGLHRAHGRAAVAVGRVAVVAGLARVQQPVAAEGLDQAGRRAAIAV
jgi:hypothetical protein